MWFGEIVTKDETLLIEEKHKLPLGVNEFSVGLSSLCYDALIYLILTNCTDLDKFSMTKLNYNEVFRSLRP